MASNGNRPIAKFPIKFEGPIPKHLTGVVPELQPRNIQRSEIQLGGKAPKDVLEVRDYGGRGASIKYTCLAKGGAMHYPVESITEDFITRIGETLGLSMAETTLRILAGQVRLISKYFLSSDEYLMHGSQILESFLGMPISDKIARKAEEAQLYTFTNIMNAISRVFEEYREDIHLGFLRMLAFDALVGLHDRHLDNWGVVIPMRLYDTPYFSPLYDNARGLLWRVEEKSLPRLLEDPAKEKFIQGCMPIVSWQGGERVNHFDLVRRIGQHEPSEAAIIGDVIRAFSIDAIERRLGEHPYGKLFSALRKKVIIAHLKGRHEILMDIVVNT